MKARVIVTLKEGVLDPQGKAIEGALRSLGIEGVESLRQGKVFDVELTSPDAQRARTVLESACEKLLANTVVENYRGRNPVKAAVVVFPGSNREGDVARALRDATGRPPAFVWHAETDLPDGTDLVVLPGGFSYGDYLRCGAIAGRAPIMDAVRAHAARGGLVLGICNGFQILCESGLLPGVLMRNRDLRFVCKMQHLRVERNDSAFTRGYSAGQIVKVAIAHGEGNYEADEGTIARLEGEGRVAFRYCDKLGALRDDANPNGSTNHIAGIYSERMNVLGLMPHPENLIDPLVGGVDGRALFAGLAA